MDFRSENTIPWMLDTAARMEAEGHDLIRRAADLRDMAEEKMAEEKAGEPQTDRCSACGQPVIADGERWRHILTTACEWRGGPAKPGDPFAGAVSPVIQPSQVPPADPAGETRQDQEMTP